MEKPYNHFFIGVLVILASLYFVSAKSFFEYGPKFAYDEYQLIMDE